MRKNELAQEREKHEAFLNTIIEQSPTPTWISDSKGMLIQMNQACRDILRVTDEELVGKYNVLQDNIVAEQGLIPLVRRVYEQGEKVRFNLHYDSARLSSLPLGKTVSLDLDVTISPVLDKRRHVANAIVQHIDITEQKRAVDALMRENALLTALMDSVPDRVYFKDAQCRFLRISRAQMRTFGLSDPSQAVGKTDFDFFSYEHAQAAYDDEQRIMRTGEPIVGIEEKETWPNRPDTWVSTSKMPLRDRKEAIIGTFGISRDITEHRRAEENILSLARFPDENPQPVMRVAHDGSIVYANKASEPLISFWEKRGGRKVPEEYAGALARAWDLGVQKEIEVTEGKMIYAVTVVPFPSAGYINLYGRNVTEEKMLAEKLTQAQKMEAVGQLAGGVAHDFNNALQIISGYCEVLNGKLAEDSPLRNDVAEIEHASRRTATLTAQLLAFSRKQVMKPLAVNAVALVGSMEKMLARVIGEDVELATFLHPDTGNIFADPVQIEQVLLNLAVNARDAMPSGGKLTIEADNRTLDETYVREHPGAREGRYVHIAVSDTGIGMAPEVLSQIFEPFFTTKEKGKGTGLGLSTVYGIVKQSDGYISCYSEPGKGTTFSIYLPLTSEKSEKLPLTETPATTVKGRETILLVEDDEAVRRFTKSILESEGYFIIEAAGGEEALSAAGSRNADVALLVTDVVMPRMGGRELARELKDKYPTVEVLFISGYTANAIVHHNILDAGLDFLQKPFSSRELLRKVRAMLDRRLK